VFFGVYERQLDDRGRVALPAALRDELGEHCYLYFGDDACVNVQPAETFERRAEELADKVERGDVSRDRLRAFSATASRVSLDKQGRVTIDQRLRELAGLAPQAPVMVLGSVRHIEIWEPGAYRASEAAGQAEIAGASA